MTTELSKQRGLSSAEYNAHLERLYARQTRPQLGGYRWWLRGGAFVSRRRFVGETLEAWRARVGLAVQRARGLSEGEILAVAMAALVIVLCVAGLWVAFA